MYMAEEAGSTQRFTQVKDTFRTSWRMLKLVWQVDPWLFSGTLLTTLLPAVIPFVNIYIYKLVIDLVVGVVSGGALDQQRLYTLIGFRIGTYFLQDAAFRAQELLERLLWTKTPIDLNEIILAKTADLDVQYFEDSQFKDLLEKIRDSLAWRPQQMTSFLFMGMQSLVQVIIAFGAIARLNWFLMIVVAAVAIPEFLNQTKQSKLAWGVWAQNSPYRKKFWYLSELMQDARIIKELKIFRLAKRFLDEVRGIQEKFYRENSRLAKRNFKLNIGFNALSTAVFVGVEIYVIYQALARRITVGDISFYTGVVGSFQSGLGGLFRNMTGVFENSLYVKSIFEVLDKEPAIKPPENPVRLNAKGAPQIEFRNVTFSYPGSQSEVLKNFSLIIAPGEKVALVGENGAGKTTIIKLLARFYDVCEGEILIDGINIKNLDLSSWYQYLGVLFQDFNRYEHTVKENISFGKVSEEISLEKVIEAATSAGAHSMIGKLEKGYEQMLGKTFEGGVELSGGQWQKIALSRAFLRNAPVLVLDEPTASLDAKAESEMFNRVERLSEKKTVIIISHRFSTVRNADKIYVIDEGRITEAGSHEELMKLNGEYAALFKLQAKGYK